MSSLTAADTQRLGRYRAEVQTFYKDSEAGFSLSREVVYNVECPICHMRSGSLDSADPTAFTVRRPVEGIWRMGFSWTIAQCGKCDYRFRVIIQR